MIEPPTIRWSTGTWRAKGKWDDLPKICPSCSAHLCFVNRYGIKTGARAVKKSKRKLTYTFLKCTLCDYKQLTFLTHKELRKLKFGCGYKIEEEQWKGAL